MQAGRFSYSGLARRAGARALSTLFLLAAALSPFPLHPFRSYSSSAIASESAAPPESESPDLQSRPPAEHHLSAVLPTPSGTDPSHETKYLRGKVMWAAEAIRRQYGVRVDRAAAHHLLVLETSAGELLPIIEDSRGKAFRKDKELLGRELTVMVRRYRKLPMIQVMRVFAVKDDGLYEIDYWCSTCAISLVHLAPCDCCQGPVERRERRVAGELEAIDSIGPAGSESGKAQP
jgi:hypothetical protein